MAAATAVVKGGFWETNGVQSLSSVQGVAALRRFIAQATGRKSLMPVRAVVRALVGAAAGGNATKTLTRIQNSTELGGKRVVETETLINRNTTAGDVTEIKHDLLDMTANTTMASPINGDRNPLGTR